LILQFPDHHRPHHRRRRRRRHRRRHHHHHHHHHHLPPVHLPVPRLDHHLRYNLCSEQAKINILKQKRFNYASCQYNKGSVGTKASKSIAISHNTS
jgi:hypothetical protein